MQRAEVARCRLVLLATTAVQRLPAPRHATMRCLTMNKRGGSGSFRKAWLSVSCHSCRAGCSPLARASRLLASMEMPRRSLQTAEEQQEGRGHLAGLSCRPSCTCWLRQKASLQRRQRAHSSSSHSSCSSGSKETPLPPPLSLLDASVAAAVTGTGDARSSSLIEHTACCRVSSSVGKALCCSMRQQATPPQ